MLYLYIHISFSVSVGKLQLYHMHISAVSRRLIKLSNFPLQHNFQHTSLNIYSYT